MRVVMRRLDNVPAKDLGSLRATAKSLRWGLLQGWPSELQVVLPDAGACLLVPANPTKDCIELLFEMPTFAGNPFNDAHGIPKQIFQCSRRREYWLEKPLLSFQEMNPEWQWNYVTDEADIRQQILELEGARALAAYDKLIPGAYKSDLWRMVVMLHKGGVYADDKIVLLHPLNTIIPPDVDGVGTHDLFEGNIQGGILVTKPGTPLLRCALERTIANIEANFYGLSGYDISGPALFGRCYGELSAEERHRFPLLWSHTGTQDIGELRGSSAGLKVGKVDDVHFLYHSSLYRLKMPFTRSSYYSNLWERRQVYRNQGHFVELDPKRWQRRAKVTFLLVLLAAILVRRFWIVWWGKKNA